MLGVRTSTYEFGAHGSASNKAVALSLPSKHPWPLVMGAGAGPSWLPVGLAPRQPCLPDWVRALCQSRSPGLSGLLLLGQHPVLASEGQLPASAGSGTTIPAALRVQLRRGTSCPRPGLQRLASTWFSAAQVTSIFFLASASGVSSGAPMKHRQLVGFLAVSATEWPSEIPGL